ncbi:MAG: AIR synthase-related protein, partial [Acidimicrobiia bacterium]|nr:AIR synthase-related protein [Acidimicrobiia bacterium]
LGLPTVAGAVVYHPGYLGNPLVYCGSVGILPHGSNPTNPQPGDLVVALGGRTGRDGVHGATFSSADLDAGTGDIASSAVQIGDPITEKQVIELVEAARDEQLYSAITDCGAGGFSSAVGELAAEVGVEVDLAAAPRKYPGLVPWEVWISESQERMVVSVPPANWDRLAQLAGRWQVEATVIGRLTGDGRLRVRHGTSLAVDLPMDFLHDGCPRRVMRAEFTERAPGPATGPGPERDPAADLLALLAQPTIASKESIIRSYDHEVRGGTLVRPWCGAEADGPTDAAVCVPLGTWDDGPAAFALGVGINPRYGLVDPYRMAHAAVDEAVRNLVCVGADPSRIALLDNFCWGNPTLADRLGGLVRASQGCHDAALAFQAPFVSGKDSLFNEFDGRPIPGTLLITALALVPDRAHVASTDPGGPGRDVYLVGETGRHLGGSMWAEIAGVDGGEVPPPVPEPLVRYGAVHAAIAAGLVRAAHDCSEGGLAVALAEMAIAGRVGMEATIGDGDLSVHEALFAETNGRLVLVCEPADAGALERTLSGLPCRRLGRTTGDGRLRLVDGAATVVDVDVEVLAAAWLGTAS